MRTAIILFATIGIIFSGYFLFTDVGPRSSSRNATSGSARIQLEGDRIVQGPLIGTRVSGFPNDGLVDQNGESVSFDTLRGQPVLISFIYTSCPSKKMCPMLTRKLVQVQEAVNAEEALPCQFVVLTFDPETDSPETLKFYGERKGVDFSNWSFWTGKPETIRRLTDRFNIAAKRDDKTDTYTHNMRTYLLDRNLKIRTAWKGSQWNPDQVLDQLRSVTNE